MLASDPSINWSLNKIKRDAENPWFIFNTEKVSWCAELDESSFSNNLDQSILIIEKGLAYWKRGLSNAKRFLSREYPFQKLGTQDFIYKQCDGTEDLKFLIMSRHFFALAE